MAAASFVAAALLAGCGRGDHHHHAHHHDHDHDHDHAHHHDHAPAAPDIPVTISAAYPLDTCPVSGERLGSMGEPVVYLHEGREIRFCCEGCVKPFQEDPARYLEAVDAAIIEQQRADYPLETCVVSGMKLGSMGDPHPHVYGNQLVLFCCEACVPAFLENPAEHLVKIEKAREE